jgi:hypothetical protein
MMTIRRDMVGFPFQTRIAPELLLLDRCMSDRGQPFVGLPGRSTNPRTGEAAYLEAFGQCSRIVDPTELIEEHERWLDGLPAGELAALRAELTEIEQCMADLGYTIDPLYWDQGQSLRFGYFPPSDWAAPEFDQQLQQLGNCGWYDLNLG